jgi:transcriptional regulator with XRE-family HTH domain
MHVGNAIRDWRQANGISASRLARMLPEQLADGQMIYRYEKSPRWLGTTANGLWLVDQGAFSLDVLRAPAGDDNPGVVSESTPTKGESHNGQGDAA